MHQLSIERVFSRKEIKHAGQLLVGQVQKTPEVEEAFRVMHNWRLHHAYPMVRERAKLTRIIKSLDGLTAGRLKRTSSIRKKLSRGIVKLDQMQDLVGCRGIVKSMDDLHEALSRYKSISEGGRVRRKDDYISSPKASGYRSVHLIVKFQERGTGVKHAGCNVEVQLRTQLQHVWSTTVEAAGSMRNEDLKAGEGDPKWLRFLTLMSGHIAEIERQPRGKHLPMSYADLRTEARELSGLLNVRENLGSFRELMNEADAGGGSYGSQYMLKMDTETGEIRVTPAWREHFAFDDLEDDFGEMKQSIEISVENMTALRQAYPNYFADTREFLNVLKDVEGKVRPDRGRRIEDLDLSFLPKVAKDPKVEKELRLDRTGYVFWDARPVGKWGKFADGSHFFRPEFEYYEAVHSKNLRQFKEDLRSWLEG